MFPNMPSLLCLLSENTSSVCLSWPQFVFQELTFLAWSHPSQPFQTTYFSFFILFCSRRSHTFLPVSGSKQASSWPAPVLVTNFSLLFPLSTVSLSLQDMLHLLTTEDIGAEICQWKMVSAASLEGAEDRWFFLAPQARLLILLWD